MNSRALLLMALALGACARQASPPSPAGAQAPIVANRQADPKATRAHLTAVIRDQAYLDKVPQDARAKVISEPFLPGLLVVYMVDEQGAARFAQTEDLLAAGVTRDALRAVADWNLAGTLAGAPTCERDSVTTIAVGNYYESSRLLLDKQWSDLAAKQGAVVVAAPSNDVLLVTCNPSPALLKKLAVAVQNTYPRAPHPISPSLWSWATGGWQELKLPQ